MLARACYALKRLPYMSFDLTAASVGAVFVTGIAWVVIATCASTLLRERRAPVSDLPCNVRREGGESLVIGGPSLVMLEGREGIPFSIGGPSLVILGGKACNPL